MTQQSGTQRQNIEQERGQQAWKNIREIKNRHDEDLEKKYRSLTRGLNAMIQINGLGQTLGFLKAKSNNELKDGRQKKTAHFYLLGHLTHWMHEHFNLAIVDTTESKNDGLLDWILHIASSA